MKIKPTFGNYPSFMVDRDGIFTNEVILVVNHLEEFVEKLPTAPVRALMKWTRDAFSTSPPARYNSNRNG